MESAIYLADSAAILPGLPRAHFQLIYIDPPFNTGVEQRRRTLRTVADEDGNRTGFQGRRYRTEQTGEAAFADSFDDYVGWLEPFLSEARELLTDSGTLYLHLDARESHYVKVALDAIFGRDCFLN